MARAPFDIDPVGKRPPIHQGRRLATQRAPSSLDRQRRDQVGLRHGRSALDRVSDERRTLLGRLGESSLWKELRLELVGPTCLMDELTVLVEHPATRADGLGTDQARRTCANRDDHGRGYRRSSLVRKRRLSHRWHTTVYRPTARAPSSTPSPTVAGL